MYIQSQQVATIGRSIAMSVIFSWIRL
jgi:hypothetical protein